jgi:Zn-dependent protease with chaperone function/ABC-type glycerol-3-phosphate transport system permease component
VQYALFEGPGSLRDPSERIAFWLTALCALPAALLIGYILHESIGVSQVALFIVIAMIYVTLARGKLLGSSVRIHEAQYPRVFEIVKRTCAALDIPMPLIFVREDNYVPVAALGFGEPYALVISSHWIEAFEDDELAFMVGRELGHIAAGHTRYLSLLSVNGNESPLIALIFGAWLRRCTFTCDKVGLLCCGSLDAAIRAMGVAAFHHFGRKIDYQAFAEQSAEIAGDPVLRWGAWLGSEPYATLRIASLRRFIDTHAYAAAEEWFLRERSDEPPSLPAPGTTTVVAKDCAGWWRRATAYGIDLVVVSAIITSFGGNPGVGNAIRTNINTSPSRHVKLVPSPSASPMASTNARALPRPSSSAKNPSPSPSSSEDVEQIGPVRIDENGVTVNGKTYNEATTNQAVDEDEDSSNNSAVAESRDRWANFPPVWIFHRFTNLGAYFWTPVYLAILVAVAGQSFGMMICGLRVVTVDFRRVGIWRSIARYAIEGPLVFIIIPLSLIWRRVLLHDKLTGTRVVKVERILARSAGTLTH